MFDKKKFLQTNFVPREVGVSVKDMKDFFDNGSEPVWLARGLTGQEYARANEAVTKNRNISVYLEGLIANNQKEKIDAVKGLIGIDEKVPDEIAKRIELLILGSVDPAIDSDIALKVCTCYPIEFYQITNEIIKLTGKGHVPGKPKASGVTQK